MPHSRSKIAGQPGWRMFALGICLILLYTLIAVFSDAISKTLVARYAAPQLMFLSAAFLVSLGLGVALTGRKDMILRTGAPRRMALRALFGSLSAISFFEAFGHLPFAQMFLFIGIMPLIGAVFSRLLLQEKISGHAWGALALGFIGVLCLLPSGISWVGFGHVMGLAGASFGTLSLVLSRGIARSHTHALAQVFYAQLGCLVLGGVLMPFVAQPVALADLGLLLAYAGLLLATRWLMVVILRLVPAHIVMQLTNIQFVWMVIMGGVMFGETTGLHVWVGAGLVMVSGLFLMLGQQLFARATVPTPTVTETNMVTAH